MRLNDETTNLDDGGDELFQKVVAQQGWPVIVDEVDQQTLNVGAILILSQSQEYRRVQTCYCMVICKPKY